MHARFFCFVALAIVFAAGVSAEITTPPVDRRRHRQNGRTADTQRSPDGNGSSNIEYRLTRLEVQVAEKNEAVRSELRETNRRLQSLEYQSSETQTTLEDLRREVARLVQGQGQGYGQPGYGQTSPARPGYDENKLQELVSGVKLVVSALRVLNSDISLLKQNLTLLTNTTSSILSTTDDLVTKQYLNRELLQMRQHNKNGMSFNPNQQVCSAKHSDKQALPETCGQVLERGSSTSGIYRIQPEHSDKSFMVYCDMETVGGGWTVIQNRYEGSQDFYQNWHEYKHGFGNLGGEFWLGLDNLHELTGYDVNELLIELEDFNSSKASAQYAAFSVGSEIEGYPLKVLSGYYGEAGDSLQYHAGLRFSTKDMDQDAWQEGSCAQAHGGGWWYRSCDTSNLNGKYLSGEVPDEYVYQGMYWGEFGGAKYSLKSSRMLIRPRDALSPPITNAVSAKQPTTA